jgi:hypothetical protein
MATGLYTLLSSIGTFLRSIAHGHTAEDRPTFDQHFDNSTGEITVTIPKEHSNRVKKVKVSYGETLQDERRDFRWIVAADKDGNCTYPYVPLPGSTRTKLEKKYSFLGDENDNDKPNICLQPILWKGQNLKETARGSGVFKT